MSTKYKVIWASAAEKDLVNIIEYIAEDSPQNVIKILAKIRTQSSDIYTMPERGRVVPELYDQGISLYRELIIEPWRLIYRISEQEIYVLSVIDSRRNVEDILLKRFIDI
ncbi:MAG: type II toxin-antitoxin system RelE/ParE family toxin [Pseudomonadota bacterium]